MLPCALTLAKNYVFENPSLFRGLILMGAGLERKYRNGTDSKIYPVPTMMISGTLDGLWRVTRQVS